MHITFQQQGTGAMFRYYTCTHLYILHDVQCLPLPICPLRTLQRLCVTSSVIALMALRSGQMNLANFWLEQQSQAVKRVREHLGVKCLRACYFYTQLARKAIWDSVPQLHVDFVYAFFVY